MSNWTIWIKSILGITLVIWAFQNCSADNFATHGNGTPYEGIDTDNPDPNLGELPDTPPQSPDAGTNGPPQSSEPIQDINFLCEYSHSQFFDLVRFGTNTSNEETVELLLIDGTLIRKKVTSGQQQIEVNYTDPRKNLSVQMIIFGNDSVSVMYNSGDSILRTELTSCTNL